MLAPAAIRRIRKPALGQDAVLCLDGGKLARTYSEKGISGRRLGILEDAACTVFTVHLKKPYLGWMQEPLPALRAYSVAEQSRVAALSKAIAAGFLLVTPARR